VRSFWSFSNWAKGGDSTGAGVARGETWRSTGLTSSSDPVLLPERQLPRGQAGLVPLVLAGLDDGEDSAQALVLDDWRDGRAYSAIGTRLFFFTATHSSS
jgi:hypothetical protein